MLCLFLPSKRSRAVKDKRRKRRGLKPFLDKPCTLTGKGKGIRKTKPKAVFNPAESFLPSSYTNIPKTGLHRLREPLRAKQSHCNRLADPLPRIKNRERCRNNGYCAFMQDFSLCVRESFLRLFSALQRGFCKTYSKVHTKIYIKPQRASQSKREAFQNIYISQTEPDGIKSPSNNYWQHQLVIL